MLRSNAKAAARQSYFGHDAPVRVIWHLKSERVKCTFTVIPMFRGSRLIILALAGLALLGATKPPEKERTAGQSDKQAEISESLKSIAATLKSIAQPNKTRHPYGPKQYDSNDDLCAQWKAADSAADAAEWGR